MGAITHDKPTTADTTTLIDDCFGQVLRAMEGGASGPEAFIFLLRLLTTHFGRIDTGKGYTKLHNFECAPRLLLAISVGSFAC